MYRIRFHFFVTLSILLGCLAPQMAWALALKLTDGMEASVSLGGHLAVFYDPTGALTIEEVASGHSDVQFQPIPSMLTQGYRKGAIWVRFSLSAPAIPKQWLLQIERPLIEQVTLYVPDGGGRFTASPPARGNLYRDKSVDPAYPALFPIPVPPAEAEYYLRLQSSTSITTALRIWQEDGYEKYRRTDYWIVGVVAGAVGAMIFANLLYAYLLRDSLYLLYAAVLVEAALISTFHMGYAGDALSWLEPAQIHRSWGVIVCLYSIVLVWFMGRLFEFRQHWIWAWRILQGVMLLNGIALMFAILGRYGDVGHFVSRLQQVSHVFTTVLVFYLILVRRQYQYVLGALAFSVMLVALLIMQNQYTATPLVNIDSSLARFLAAGTLLHLVLLSAAVAQRARLAELSLSEEKDRIIAISQLAERELTIRVNQRIIELAEKNAALKLEVDRRHLLEIKLRQSLDAVNEALAQQRDFVALISHEFRGPLAVIAATADNLSSYAAESIDTLKLRAAKIRQTVRRMALLLENVLADDRVHAGQKLSHAIQMFDLNEVLQAIQAGLDDVSAARVKLLPGDEVMVKGDRGLLEIVLQNLLQNALQYSPVTSSVTVRLWADNGVALVSIVDQGRGVAPDDREFIFMKYFRAAGQRVRGSGLGLYISRQIARQHGGDVILAATDAGGSTFCLTLPIDDSIKVARRND
ncbi:sensor histidine kinase [Methylocella sp. CPCC 101449]|uniref:sensor histidine kinase n=1 Tax=Methylocella sp. CPCC 101449 TaxID=2987531 RepID=UPI00288CFC23|nr:sensor histidine kinase [Methylocella sp. CPCC 101449]MDT2021218.1 sensor histidine kinase [Methylocella sp. CPCC 101449]